MKLLTPKERQKLARIRKVHDTKSKAIPCSVECAIALQHAGIEQLFSFSESLGSEHDKQVSEIKHWHNQSNALLVENVKQQSPDMAILTDSLRIINDL